jgi:Cu-Zn family superoxide dismutase
MGDLQNVTVGKNGRLRVQIVVPGTYLKTAGRNVPAGTIQILDANGASLVLHAKPDDYKTDPSGNSGARIACAVLGSPAEAAQSGAAPATAANTAAANVTVTNEAAGNTAR